MNKFLTEYGQLSENPLSLPCTANSSCGLAGRFLLKDVKNFDSEFQLINAGLV